MRMTLRRTSCASGVSSVRRRSYLRSVQAGVNPHNGAAFLGEGMRLVGREPAERETTADIAKLVEAGQVFGRGDEGRVHRLAERCAAEFHPANAVARMAELFKVAGNL